MTPKALCYMGEKEIQHKAIFIAEYEGVRGADYAIRTLQSEKFIEWTYVDTKRGIEKKTSRVLGPAAFLQATTRPVLHPENETRLLFIHVDESEEQTRAINRSQALRYATGALQPDETILTKWQEYIRSLTLTQVIVPFADSVADHFPTARIRSRRDFPKLMGMIQTSAFLHQHRREKRDDKIVAAPEDYRIARELFSESYETSPDQSLEKLLKATEELGKTLADFTIQDIMQCTGWKKSKTYDLTARAEELGCIAETDVRGRYRFLRTSTVPPLNLPDEL